MVARQNQIETDWYIRTIRGETFYVDSLEEALEEFTGPDGYRLTLGSMEGLHVVIRREDLRPSLFGQETNATVDVIRPRVIELKVVE